MLIDSEKLRKWIADNMLEVEDDFGGFGYYICPDDLSKEIFKLEKEK